MINYVNVCNGRVLKVGSISLNTILISIMDIFVLLLCVFSLVLCCRALFNSFLLQKRTRAYFEEVLHQKFSLADKWEFVNMWFVIIVINDAFIILGTLCKVTIEFRDFDNDLFTFTGIFLGIGTLLVYIGLFRYLGFFNQYNVLMLTLKKALPNLLRFMVCTIILYVAFLLAGWVIIGPYSMKFRTLSQSSEALFSLLNGDDMFATFYTIDDSNTTIKIFGKIYIYVFVALFIYMVLSVFIAIIMDAFEAVKAVYNDSVDVETSAVKEFIGRRQGGARAPPFWPKM
uniref:Polycystin cation channel PKD1/PKD2 domain-containing protein n=1 Tax=Acrobeloides nanus TaxID=290746 RepID=A0A914DHW8_9BILA